MTVQEKEKLFGPYASETCQSLEMLAVLLQETGRMQVGEGKYAKKENKKAREKEIIAEMCCSYSIPFSFLSLFLFRLQESVPLVTKIQAAQRQMAATGNYGMHAQAR